MAINVDELSRELLKDEQLRLVVYDDKTAMPLHPGMVCQGHPTIGIGRALDVHGLSRDEAFYLLRNDIAQIDKKLSTLLPWYQSLDPIRQCTLANMAFNLGVEGLLSFHQTLTLIQTSQYAAAAAAMLASKWAAQVGDRAKRLAEQIRTGQPATV